MATLLPRKVWQTLASIRTGVILLILVVILAAAGTLILQRPTTDPDELQRAYSPQMLRILDALGLTNVFHAWWFVLLLTLVSLSIIAASSQRFPNAWRFYSRPYKSPDENFRKAQAIQAVIPVKNEEAGLSAAEHGLRKSGFKAEHIVRQNSFSLFSEKNRFSEMAVYIVHASLLLIFLGTNIDALYGWRAFLMLGRGEQSNQVQPQNSSPRTLPFYIRCDSAGRENYADGSPKKWWSNLSVMENGNVVLRKQIVVNEPLVYGGLRFYQASFGDTGKIDRLELVATPRDGREQNDFTIGLDQTLPLDSDNTIRLAEFFPDYAIGDGRVYARSNNLENPAAHLIVESKKTGKQINVWRPPIPGLDESEALPYTFQAKDVQMAYFTGLEVSHEPGQWSVWAGVVLLGVGLAVVFYLVHMRIWVVPVRDARGQLALWIGGTANKNRDAFEHRFAKLVEHIKQEINNSEPAGVETSDAPVASR